MALPDGYTAVGRETLTAELLTGADVRDPEDKSIAQARYRAVVAARSSP